jgi:hypothetical protein
MTLESAVRLSDMGDEFCMGERGFSREKMKERRGLS